MEILIGLFFIGLFVAGNVLFYIEAYKTHLALSKSEGLRKIREVSGSGDG